MASISFRKLYKEYPGNVTAVKDFNLEVKDKEFVVFVGPSGCGKSTTLRMIAGLEDITEGEIYIEDKLINDIPPKDRDIAMVFQSYALYPHMTVFDNMAFALKLKKVTKSEIDERVRAAARILDIENLLKRKPKALSGGQRQRVALGRAIVRDAKVFLMDEPLSNLDAKLRVQTRTEIIKLHQKLQTTFIYVTHDQTEAMTMGDKIVVMKDGVIQQVDRPMNIYNSPKNMFVAGFIGSPQMNFIEVNVIEKEDHIVRLMFQGYEIKLPEFESKIMKDKNYMGKSLILGIRPEDVGIRNIIDESLTQDGIEAVVDVAEMMGSDIFLYIKIGDIDIISRINSDILVESGEKIRVSFNIDKIHLFDKDTEESIFIREDRLNEVKNNGYVEAGL